MEKQFNITFDLSKMEVFIPSGRLMNLKQRLNWDDIACSEEELSQLSRHVSAQNFQLNMDFTKKAESFINNTMKSQQHKETRKFSYAERGINRVLSPGHFSEVTTKLTEELRGQLEELLEDTKENEQVKKKILKLAQLRMMNT